MRTVHPLPAGAISRSTFIRGLAGGLAVAAAGGPLTPFPAMAGEREEEEDENEVQAVPKPIPGGLDISPATPPFIHVHGPGPKNLVLPFSEAKGEGLDVEPSTITDFKAVVAMAYHVGSATGSDGKTYNLETDVRAFQGEFIAADETHHRGTFALL